MNEPTSHHCRLCDIADLDARYAESERHCEARMGGWLYGGLWPSHPCNIYWRDYERAALVRAWREQRTARDLADDPPEAWVEYPTD